MDKVIQELHHFVDEDDREDALVEVKLQRLRMWLRLLEEAKEERRVTHADKEA